MESMSAALPVVGGASAWSGSAADDAAPSTARRYSRCPWLRRQQLGFELL